jgi:hypothetical protein
MVYDWQLWPDKCPKLADANTLGASAYEGVVRPSLHSHGEEDL